jgi:hypothetical protein
MFGLPSTIPAIIASAATVYAATRRDSFRRDFMHNVSYLMRVSKDRHRAIEQEQKYP